MLDWYALGMSPGKDASFTLDAIAQQLPVGGNFVWWSLEQLYKVADGTGWGIAHHKRWKAGKSRIQAAGLPEAALHKDALPLQLVEAHPLHAQWCQLMPC